MKTFFHPAQRLHHPRTYLSRGQMRQPQELPARIDPLLAMAEKLGYPLLVPHDYGQAPLAAVHSAAYLDYLSSAYQQWHEVPEDWGDEVMSNIYIREGNPLRGILGKTARYLADGSCPIGEHTWQSAYWSAQSAVAAAHAVIDGDPSAYALCRPPGHHARGEAAGGFCFLNNAAIAAQVLRGRFSKVAVLDTDMHHGQGIQEIFYDRDDVLYVSIHGDPTNFYPVVAGFEDETGTGAGEGFNLNLPMPHGASEADFFSCMDQAASALRTFGPDVLVLSLGFDIYENDPQSKVSVSHEGFRLLGQRIKALGIPCVVVQEGGYDIATLDENASRFFAGMTA
ncbi:MULTISPECIES: histone deacetylase family protein [unclassified Pseudomonas]|uniref:histone deacetylase family protein n=1 Tax=unclassified Pseudomonas TaxID=196821 RepID=UPI0008C150D0|nr:MULTISPECIES: histone deacetylase family protein [unclassified Pseudomonas]SEO57376.1 Acetoin utilization deacetylase AcuC [Pseudomonas sp. NFACC39-1]SFG93886.1 Acetoin utilization deacetylase AcuC [Pseudomonas sp. NFACC45]